MSPHSEHTTGDDSRADRGLLHLVLFPVGLCYALVCLPPWIPAFLSGVELRDPSWEYALHEAWRQGRQFGSEVVFTYGPYGFLTTRTYHPDTYWLMTGLWGVLAGALYWNVWRLADQAFRSGWLTLAVSMIVVRIAALDAVAFLFAFPALLAVRCFSTADRSEKTGRTDEPLPSVVASMGGLLRLCGLVFAVGMLPLTKFTAVPVVGLLLLLLVVRSVGDGEFPLTALVVCCVTAGLWWAAGQQAAGFLRYLHNGFEVAVFYESAMSVWETSAADVAFMGSCAAVGLLLPVLLWRSRPICLRNAVLAWMFFTALLFVMWKSAFVRFHPGKSVLFPASACLTMIVLALSLKRDARSPVAGAPRLPGFRLYVGVSLCVALLVWGTIRTQRALAAIQPSIKMEEAVTEESVKPPGCVPAEAGASEKPDTNQQPGANQDSLTIKQIAGRVFWTNEDQLSAVASLTTDPAWRERRHRAACRRVAARHPLPQLSGTLDVVPHKLVVAFAHPELSFQPRPVMQSYSAYSPPLAEMNAAHYRSDNAPENVLFRVAPLDDRFPAQEDGALWRALLERYQPAGTAGKYLWLRRAQTPPRIGFRKNQLVHENAKAENWYGVRLVDSTTVTARFGHRIRVPQIDGDLLWCRVNISPTLTGRIAGLVYKRPHVVMHVTTDAGTRRYRLVPGMARAGFLLSPVVRTTEDFAALWDDGPAETHTRSVRRIRFTTTHPRFRDRLFDEGIEIRFERLEFPSPE